MQKAMDGDEDAYVEIEALEAAGDLWAEKWEDLDEDFLCPICSVPKSEFNPIIEETTPEGTLHSENRNIQPHDTANYETSNSEELAELSSGEISAICSSLAKGCEKQRLNLEMEAFIKIAGYFRSKAAATFAYDKKGVTLNDAAKMLDDDLTKGYAAANEAAKTDSLQGGTDRGALRSLVWSEKVSAMGKALLERFEKEGEAMLANTKIFVCDICGFIFLGDIPPDICPVCKVPKHKLLQVERRLS
jgi:rubrerythrin